MYCFFTMFWKYSFQNQAKPSNIKYINVICSAFYNGFVNFDFKTKQKPSNT